MNIKRLEALRDYENSNGRVLYMRDFTHDLEIESDGTYCGTAYCHAGWVCEMNGRAPDLNMPGFEPWKFAKKYLGLSEETANFLFRGVLTARRIRVL